MELFYAEGPQIVKTLKERGHKVFLDLKLHDIPNTVKKTMQVLGEYGVDMVNVHAAGGIEMMKAAKEGLMLGAVRYADKPKLIAVTQLTSTDEETMHRELLIDKPLDQVVRQYALNAKAALAAIQELGEIPVMISVSVGDRSGRTLTGQTIEAFYTSVSHYPILSFGLNCSLGASELMPLMEDIGKWCSCAVSCYPNAGLPNEMGGYDQSPEEMAVQLKVMAEKGLVNIVGGCCGTTPAHIKAIAEAVKGMKPRDFSGKRQHVLKISGLEAVIIDIKRNNFTNVGERTNVAGSRKFARLIASGEYDQALQIAARQIARVFLGLLFFFLFFFFFSGSFFRAIVGSF